MEDIRRFLFRSIRSFCALLPPTAFDSPRFPTIATPRRNMILNGMQRDDSADIRRLKDIHNTVAVTSGRLRIRWNTANWPQPSPLFYSFAELSSFCTSSPHPCEIPSRMHLAHHSSATPTNHHRHRHRDTFFLRFGFFQLKVPPLIFVTILESCCDL